MKTIIIERIIIFLAFNLYKIVALLFIISLLMSTIIYCLVDRVPIVIGYIFWFCFGAFTFGLIIRKATVFLSNKYEQKNNYYLDLLNKRKD